jgi:hypothetical protein
MNRLEDLKITLPFNISANEDYANLEFVLLDYSSSDGLDAWIKRRMMRHIESGRLIYYRLEGRKYYDMCPARNIVFKLATGDIVNNLDADNFTSNGTPVTMSWATWLNRTANNSPYRTVFIKSMQLSIIHGRIGFHKKAFIELLGGYDEDLVGYGHDDQNIVERALALGFQLCKWGGSYFYRIQTREKKNDNLLRPWEETRAENKKLTIEKLARNEFKANEGREWGKATVVRNFKEEIII